MATLKIFLSFTRCSQCDFLYLYGTGNNGGHGVIFVRALRHYLFTYLSYNLWDRVSTRLAARFFAYTLSMITTFNFSYVENFRGVLLIF